MKRFLLKTAVWTLPGAIGCLGLWLGLLYSNPRRDTIGLNRLIPKSCNSMIFGTSRSAQGVNPEILEQHAPGTGIWFNFSFNLGASPWNDTYVDAIIEKIECSIDPSLPSHFLIFADPWTLDEFCGAGEQQWFQSPGTNPCGTSILRYGFNHTTPLDVLGYGSGGDLLSVIVSSAPRQLKEFITRKPKFTEFSGVQKNGWLPNSGEFNLQEKQRLISRKVASYEAEKVFGKTWPHKENSDALRRLIDHLQSELPESKLFLVRPPVADLMLELEDRWFPETNYWLEKLCTAKGITFIESNARWTEKTTMDFNDGHHMSIQGAYRFSHFLAESLISKD